MTTVHAPNVANIAIEGTFDDCQDLVKAMFADAPFRQEMQLSAMNSINWARIAAQVPYYVAAALALGAPDREVAFSVPTGNFGNVLAAWVARRMGLPVARLIVGSNRNDILARFLAVERHVDRARSSRACRPAWTSRSVPTSSACCSSCWIAIRRATAAAMADFRRTGPDGGAGCGLASLPHGVPWLPAGRCRHRGGDRAGCTRRRGYLADPHTAIGIAAARAQPAGARRADGRDGDGASGEDSPMRSSAPPASVPPCRRGSPICSIGRSASPCCRTIWPRSRRRCARWRGATHEDPRCRADRGGAAVRAADPGVARSIRIGRRGAAAPPPRHRAARWHDSVAAADAGLACERAARREGRIGISRQRRARAARGVGQLSAVRWRNRASISR